MDFITICSEIHGETTDSGSFPTTVVGVTGEHARTVRWAKNAWREIQNRHQNWLWLRSTFTFNTAAGDDDYAYGEVTDSRLTGAITRFARWWLLDNDQFPNVKCYLTSAGVAGEHYLIPLSWPAFRDLYKRGTQTNNVPIHITVDPHNKLVLGPKPNDIFTVTGEYQMSAQVLTDDADTPEIPEDFHQLIVYEAMKKYGGFRAAMDAVSRGITEGNKLMRQLEARQRPECALAGPLV